MCFQRSWFVFGLASCQSLAMRVEVGAETLLSEVCVEFTYVNEEK